MFINKGKNMYLQIVNQLNQLIEWLLNWPLMIYVIGVSILCTVALRGIQFTHFFSAVKMTFAPSKSETSSTGDMSPVQAFLNTLSANLGNGSLAGMAVAIYAGGPGAPMWTLLIGFVLMAVRFAEVYLSTLYGARTTQSVLGGPMLYLKDVPGGTCLAYIYSVLLIFFAGAVGNAIQANSICMSINTTWGIDIYIIAAFLTAFVAYVVLGGSARIVKVSDRIVPIKVIVFFVTSLIVLFFHYHALYGAFLLMLKYAFQPMAPVGGFLGFSVQQAMRYGIERSIMATESGLGTAAILFGFTGSKDPKASGLMGMLSTFISTLVCLIISLCIIASGVWDNGQTGAALTIAAFSTVFGSYGGWIVSFLSISFGMGVLVTFAYISRVTWLFLTNGKYALGSSLLYCAFTVFGSLINVNHVWHLAGIVNGLLLMINLFGVAYLLPVICKNLYNR
jgi:AGCS family alanine or glycine:cation symporter